jgi:hypothetical protein
MPPIPALQALRPLAGTWRTVLRWSEETHKLVGGPKELLGKARFQWLEGGRFLHYEFGPSHWIIGGDDASSEYCVLYSDDREVARVYRMTWAGGVWRIWREAPGFHQRFEGRLQNRGRTIRAHWERSSDGATWAHDFDLTFTRPAPARR